MPLLRQGVVGTVTFVVWLGVYASQSTAAPLVFGESQCPSVDAVDRILQGMLSDNAEVQIKESARVASNETGPFVELTNEAGVVVMRESLGTSLDCAALAEVAAIKIATRLEMTHPELIVQWPVADVAKAPDPPAPPVNKPAQPVALPLKRPAWVWQTGIGLSASATGGASLGVSGLFEVVPSGTGFGGHLGVSAILPRQAELSGPGRPGEVQWTRMPLSLGPVLRLALAPGNLDLRVVGQGAWLSATGRNLPEGTAAQSFNGLFFGAGAGIRAATRDGPLLKWIDISVGYWPSRPVAEVVNRAQVQAELPVIDLFLTLGVSWCPTCGPT